MKRFAASVDSETDENIWETVEDAYVYAFPLVLMDATETSATNTEEVVTKKAPVNQFIHSVALADAQFRTVVTPNVDPITFFNKANELMVKNSPTAADKEMLEKVGMGVCMKNGSQDVKECSAFVSPYTNDESAVGRFIEENVFKEEMYQCHSMENQENSTLPSIQLSSAVAIKQ